jgi:hypothetical protein
VNFLWRVGCARGDREDRLAVKIFGPGGDDMLDREKGKRLIAALHKQGICAPIHAM